MHLAVFINFFNNKVKGPIFYISRRKEIFIWKFNSNMFQI